MTHLPGVRRGGGSADGQESVYGRMPVLLGEREYGTAGAHTTCFAYAIATWCFLTGSYVADLVGAVQGVMDKTESSMTMGK